MICSKIANKITSVSKNSAKELQNKETEVDVERATTRKDTYFQKKDNKLLVN